MSEETRQIIVDGNPYGWRVTHRHRRDTSSPSGRICVDHFMAFRSGSKNAPLRISFPAGPSGDPEPIERHGVVRIHTPSMILNLHRPRTAAALIRGAVELGWLAEAPMQIKDGFSFVSALPAAVQADIAEPGVAHS